MNRFSRIVFLVLALVMAISMVAFAEELDEAAWANRAEYLKSFKSDKPESEWKLAVVPQYGPHPWWVRGNEGTKRFAEETGLNAYEASPAEGELAAQMQVVEDLIAQGVDAICICTIDPDAIAPLLQTALDKGIVVLSHEAATLKSTLFDIEAFSNEDYGAHMMDLLAGVLNEEGTYATMVGHVTKVSHMTWTGAEVARQLEAYPNMQLLGGTNPTLESTDTTEGAYERAKEMLTAHPEVKGILTCGSTEPAGVARAVEELGLTGQFSIVGTGLPSELKPYLEDGSVTYVGTWDPAAACYTMLSIATKILRGEDLDVINGIDSGWGEGWEALKPITSDGIVLAGQGWNFYSKDTVDQILF